MNRHPLISGLPGELPENSPPQSPHPVSAFGIGGRWNAKTRPAGSALLWAPLWQAQCSKRVSWFYVAGGFHPPASWINVEDRNKCPACLITCRFYPPENSPPQSPHPASAFGIGGRYSPGINDPGYIYKGRDTSRPKDCFVPGKSPGSLHR